MDWTKLKELSTKQRWWFLIAAAAAGGITINVTCGVKHHAEQTKENALQREPEIIQSNG